MNKITVCKADAYIDPKEAVGFDDNPRQSLSERERRELRRSLDELGLFRALLAWKTPDGQTVIIGGNQRFSVISEAVKDGVALVHDDGSAASGIPVTFFNGPEEKARLVALRDNNADGDWDYTKLSDYLGQLSEVVEGTDLDLLLSGFDEDILEDLVSYATDPEVTVMNAAASSEVDKNEVEAAAAERAEELVDTLTDPSESLVAVTIGHIRGRIKHDTYTELVEALSLGIDSPDGGLDVAVRNLLKRLS